MGRTSKFSFPLPGRKHVPANKDKERASIKSSSGTSNNLSKAQRILGTDNDLNIDSPSRSDDHPHSWNYPSSRSSGMSISISESTQSTSLTADTGSLSSSNVDQWDHESGVFPRAQRLRGKASSTLLGQHYMEDAATDTSSVGRRMRHEGSDSTLKSYYDRQKSPLSISQQTSESSARDLALRKGFPPVVQRSPLLQVESNDPFDSQYTEPNLGDVSRDKSMRKKPAKLDLSMLFPRSRRNGTESSALSPSSITTSASRPSVSQNLSSTRRKLTKALSKESLQSQKHSIHSTQSNEPKQREASLNVYNNFEHLSVRSPHMSQIPESRILERETHSTKTGNGKYGRPLTRTIPITTNESQSQFVQPRPTSSQLSPANSQSFPCKNVRPNLTSPPWEVSSSASISSHNTKASRRTSTSVFSHSDLKQSSVLSLSSDSDGETSDPEPVNPHSGSYNDKASRVPNGTSETLTDNRRYRTQQPQGSGTAKQKPKKGAAAPNNAFHPILETSLPNPRVSGPWSPADSDGHRTSLNPKPVGGREQRSSKTSSSVGSKRSPHRQSLTPSSSVEELQEGESLSGRYMAVTKQEEALLEALRQKRARMREKIIEEHEIAKSPPHVAHRSTSRYSEASSVSTLRGLDGSTQKESILLYLATPVSDVHPIDTAEPSPDLSDFLSFGSDEDSTPRTSWAPPPPTGKPRPDSSIRRSEKFSPMTPPSAARLSAVGAGGGLRDTGSSDGSSALKKRNNSGVRFVDEGKLMNPQDFLMDENESDVIWGM